jgi:dGTPase
LGHPPFGHRGEQALHECMLSYGGFEANAQTFRILTSLEGKNQKGLNLTRGMLLSIMKYPILLDRAINPNQPRAEPPKASIYSNEEEMFHWVLAPLTEEEREYLTAVKVDSKGRIKTKHKTLECSIIELADDIAYGTHDVEDAINLGFIRLEQLNELFAQFKHIYDHPHFRNTIKILNQLLKQGHHNKYLVKRVSSSLISTFVYSITIQKQDDDFSSPRCRYRAVLEPELRRLLDQLREIVFEYVIYSQKVQTVNWRGSYIVKRLFAAIMEETRLLPENDRKKINSATSEQERARIICDYLAGMTDSFALRMYERLYGNGRNFFDY